MPEKKFWTRHVGMETLNSVGSTGSCDSIESISSNHSAFSGEGYDHLSAEERECLMFLEETIESLDNEDDSGLSTDELENTNKADSHLVLEPAKIQFSAGNEKISPKITELPKSEQWTNTVINSKPISQGHHSFPRVQVCNEESTKQPFNYEMGGSKKDQPKLCPEKPKRMSLLNQQQTGQSQEMPNFLILPPPEAFRDPQIVDKRHSVTDPTDAREVRFDRIVLKSAVIPEHQVASDKQLPLPVYPRASSPHKFLIGEQETLSQTIVKPSETQFKQGPPTAPKPRTLPPHIVIKTSRGDIPNLDPQKRPRTFSAHERSTDKANDPLLTNVLHSKEQERARHEALQKLGLGDKSSSRENTIPPFKTDLPSALYGSEQGKKEANRKSVLSNQQEETDSSRSTPTQPLVPQTTATNVKNEMLARNRLSVKSVLIERADQPASSILLLNQKEVSYGPTNSDIIKTRHSEKTNPQEKPEELTTPSLTEVHGVTDNSKNLKSEIPKHALQLNPVPQRKENVTDESDHQSRETDLYPDSHVNQSQDISRKPVKLPTTTTPAQALRKIDYFKGNIAQENKAVSLENINIISTSPRNSSSFSPSRQPLVTQHSPKVLRNDGKGRPPVDKSNRHSTHFEQSEEPYLRLPQGLVPGLRQINIKSNTLERSGVGLSSSLPSIEKGSNSFFKKPLFSGNFLRNNRPRPASLGTGKDFANLEPSAAAVENTEKHSFFSRPSRQSAPVTSVKIAPKGSTDEHRRQALKKLGILKE